MMESYGPLLDLFRRGEVSRDIRLLAASGSIQLRSFEQFGLLLLLTADSDPEIAASAEVTLLATPRPVVAWYLAQPDASPEVVAYFASRSLIPTPDEGVAPPAEEAALPAADIEVVAAAADDTAENPEPEILGTDENEDEDPDEERRSVLEKIAQLNVAERISLAMKGTREERAILIRDPNKIVGASVLSSPKLSETEVESIARMATVSEDVLRMIGNSRNWTKNYSIMIALVKNPKTPLAMSMNFLPRVSDKDLRMLSTSRSIPEVLRVSARKKIVLNK